MKTFTGETCTSQCHSCGTYRELKRFVGAGGDAAWEPQEHESPCGLPCRPSARIGRAHGWKWCSSCGPITPRTRREFARRVRRRTQAARRKAA